MVWSPLIHFVNSSASVSKTGCGAYLYSLTGKPPGCAALLLFMPFNIYSHFIIFVSDSSSLVLLFPLPYPTSENGVPLSVKRFLLYCLPFNEFNWFNRHSCNSVCPHTFYIPSFISIFHIDIFTEERFGSKLWMRSITFRPSNDRDEIFKIKKPNISEQLWTLKIYLVI